MFRAAARNESGKHGLTSNPLKAMNSALPLSVPCQQCLSCRLDKADMWATRLTHEAKMHEDNAFITLTYADEHVPVSYSVDLDHWQRFMKRLRARITVKVRYCACAEYGEKGGRPHYHALIFGYGFPDRKYHCKRDGYPVWKSAELEAVWPFGLSELGSVEANSAGYVSRYCVKKITGEKADDHYYRVSPIDGERYRVAPEFMVMSRGGKSGGGIGSTWFDRYAGDAFPSDFIIRDGIRKPVPPYYLNRLAAQATGRVDHLRPGHYLRDLASGEATQIKRKRALKAAAPRVKANNTPQRLLVRAEVRRLKAERLARDKA